MHSRPLPGISCARWIRNLDVVGAVAIAVDKRNRRLGDMVAGTVVVHELQELGDSYWYGQHSTAATAPSVEAIAAMTAQEFQLIETFLNRRLDLPYDQRQKTAVNIVTALGHGLMCRQLTAHLPRVFLRICPGATEMPLVSGEPESGSPASLSRLAVAPGGQGDSQREMKTCAPRDVSWGHLELNSLRKIVLSLPKSSGNDLSQALSAWRELRNGESDEFFHCGVVRLRPDGSKNLVAIGVF